MIDQVPPEAFLATYPEPLAAVAHELRAVVRRAMPDSVERVRLGWQLIGYDVPVGRRTVYFAWVWPESVHVHLGFVYGAFMDDPNRLLNGRVVRARWVTFVPGDEINPGPLEELVRESARVARMSRAERLGRMLDREIGAPRQ